MHAFAALRLLLLLSLLHVAASKSKVGKKARAAGAAAAAAGGKQGAAALLGQNGTVDNSTAIGFAALNGGTTGGAGGRTVTVSTAKALKAAVSGNEPRIVRLTAFLSKVKDVRVGSNKTILGVGSKAGFKGGSLVLSGVRNVIIRNLVMQKCQGGDNDCISITGGTTNVWVDHNDLSGDMSASKDKYDGLVDVTHASSFVTVSNNYLHNHHKAMLLGSADTSTEDERIRVTVHNNLFSNLGSRAPSIRFGKVHVFNNVFEDIEISTVNARMGAQALVEGNAFINAKEPVTSINSVAPGFCVLRDNDLGGGEVSCTGGNFTAAPYPVKVLPESAIEALVRPDAGAGKILT